MSLRIANTEDFDTVCKLIKNFYSTITLSELIDEQKVKGIIWNFLNSSNEEKIVLLHGEVGVLGAIVQPFLFGVHPIATEVAWWVEPEARKQNVGRELVEAFEFWAKKLNCKYAALSCYADNDVGKFYESLDYKLHEKVYIKGL